MPTLALAVSQGSRFVAIAHEEAVAARMPRLAFDFFGRGAAMIVESWRGSKGGRLEDCGVCDVCGGD